MAKKLALGMILSAIAGVASAVPVSSDRLCKSEYLFRVIPHEVCETPKFNTRSVVAPEIDPASAIAGLTLMLGGLAVVRGRRDRKTNHQANPI